MSKTRETAPEPGAETSAAGAEAGAAPEASTAAEMTGMDEVDQSGSEDARAEPPTRERGDVAIALSPGQILGGFALMAGFIVMLRRRRKDRG